MERRGWPVLLTSMGGAWTDRMSQSADVASGSLPGWTV
jgi:hypothetical protein